MHEAVAVRLPSALMGASRLKRQGETQDCSAGLENVGLLLLLLLVVVWFGFCFALFCLGTGVHCYLICHCVLLEVLAVVLLKFYFQVW